MIRHLVLFRLRDEPETEQAAHVAEMRNRLLALQGVTPGVTSLAVEPDVVGGTDHWDVALVGDFVDRAALDAYQVHPDHRSAVAWMGDFVVDRAIADIEYG